MPKPLATIKQSAPDQSALIELFQRLGRESLESAITAQVGGEFYQSLLNQVKANRQIPEFKGISKSKVTATLESLITKCNAAQIDAWNFLGSINADDQWNVVARFAADEYVLIQSSYFTKRRFDDLEARISALENA